MKCVAISIYILKLLKELIGSKISQIRYKKKRNIKEWKI